MNRTLVVALSFLTLTAQAAGFRLDDMSAKSVALGGAVSAFVDDASAAYFNPAGLVNRGNGFDARVGIALIAPALHFTHSDGDQTSTPFSVAPPPHLFASYTFLDKLAVGLGFYTPFGASVNWPSDWEGRFHARTSSLTTYAINPNVAYMPHPRVRLGLGFNVLRGTLGITRALDFVDSEGAVQLGGAAWGVGFNAGFQAEVVEKLLYVGGTYRSSVGMTFTGRAHFTDVPAEFGSRINDQGISGSVLLPDVGTFGIGVKPIEKLKLALDFTFVRWAAFKELRIEFENPDLTVPLAKQWFDTVSVHVGGEYQVTKSVTARLGFVVDPTPSPSVTLTPDLPDATRIKVGAGVGWVHDSGFAVDVGYQFVALIPHESVAPGFSGTYSGTAQVLAVTLGYHL
ncbi:MAG: outer membrane protein transport protein [Myxococcaceae bacterium]|nr:outer membrane protein transport protein [Myxococcaceae bacterium]